MNNMTFFKGVGVGVAMGAMMSMAVLPRKKKLNISRALKSMGDVMDNVAGTLGL